MKPTPKDWPRISSSIFYDDAPAAIDWLCKAFGFEVRIKVEGGRGRGRTHRALRAHLRWGCDHGGQHRRGEGAEQAVQEPGGDL